MSVNLRAIFDREFEEVRQEFVRMSQMVENAISSAMTALIERDLELAHQVIDNDNNINQIRYHIEEACLTLIATQQPAAGDLRAIIAVMHMVVEMERMGDYAAGIAKTVILMSEEPLLKTIKRIPRMGKLCQNMLGDAIQAFLLRDETWAREIATQDEKMDELYQDVFNKLIKIMAKDPDLITRATYLMWCAHNLERIADRVTNIAEQIIFMTTGMMGELDN